ncbi:MAG: NPCBM/NEW2 domain-containing protein [Phycisphaeraceae bacterium]
MLIASVLIGLLSNSLSARDVRREEERRLRADRYMALFRDGNVQVAREARDWQDPKREPSINGRRLFDENNPIRILRDTTIQPALEGPYIEFANGDILPGRAIGGVPADGLRRMPSSLIIQVSAPLTTFDRRSGEVSVRPEWVSRVVLTKEARGPIDPGTLFFTDGTKKKVKAIRWALGGVRALTDEGTIAAGWLELAEVHPPAVDPVAALLEDVFSPGPQAKGVNALIGRVTASNGAVLTYRRSLLIIDGNEVRDERGYYHTFQPAWALQSIRVPFDEVVSRSYREPDELPLSLLPGTLLSQKSATGFLWPWHRNVSVRGHELAVSQVLADLGLGTHSYSELSFNLPPYARQFKTSVGINRGVGSGGCAKVKLFRDKVTGNPVWESNFLRGNEEAAHVDGIDVNGWKQLVLVTDYAHEGRPRGADPLDIRDEVDWVWPTVKIDLNEASKTRKAPTLAEALPQLEGWTIPQDVIDRSEIRVFWNRKEGRWENVLYVDRAAERYEHLKPFDLTRKVTITGANGWLPLSMSRDDGQIGHELKVLVDGEEVKSALNGDINTSGRTPGDFEDRFYSFGQYLGKEITITLRIEPRGGNGQKPAGILFGTTELEPLLLSAADDGMPIKPEVPLTSLMAVKTEHRKDVPWAMKAGTYGIDAKPIVMKGIEFKDGWALPRGPSEMVYELDPSWKRFVAVIGMVEGSAGAGPFEVLLDDEVVWRTETPSVLGRSQPLWQVNVAIPPGHKTITLRIDKSSPAAGAWADSGFMKK